MNNNQTQVSFLYNEKETGAKFEVNMNTDSDDTDSQYCSTGKR